MTLQFERGDPRQPKGHALVYFKSSQDATRVLATYVVVMPIPLQLGKYLPPLFAAQMPDLSAGSSAVVPIPPVPEEMESLAYLQRLANARDDDLIYGGTLTPGDLGRAVQMTSEIGQRYLSAYSEFMGTVEALDAMVEAQPETSNDPELGVREVLYSMMSEHDRLQELTKLTGQLRYAIDGKDERLAADTTAEMERLGRYLAAKYRFADFLRAARLPGETGQRLAALYLDRCYKLYKEDYTGLAQIEEALKQAGGGQVDGTSQ